MPSAACESTAVLYPSLESWWEMWGGSWSKAGVGTSTGNVSQEGQEAAVGSGKGSGLLFSDLHLMQVVRLGNCQIGR